MKNHGRSARLKRVLIVSQWFDPEPTFKGIAFAKKLQQEGWDVSVLTGFPNYPGGKLYDGYRITPFKRENIEGIRVVRVALYPSHDGSAVRRVLNYLTFSIMATLAVLFIKRPDVAYIYHPPGSIGLVAQILKFFRGTPYVFDVQDLWPDTLASTGMLNSPRILRLISKFMSGVYRGAEEIAVLSAGFRDRLVSRGVPGEKISVISNWTYEHTEKRPEPQMDEGDLTIIYAGNFGVAQNLRVVLDAAELLNSDAVRFQLYGSGIEGERLVNEARERGLSNVEFHGRRTTDEIEAILHTADALLVHLIDDPLFEITIPSKIQAYLRTGRPILLGVKGEAADLVGEAQAGLLFTPESANDLARAVREFKRLSFTERRLMGESGQRFYEENLSLAVGGKKFSNLLSQAALQRPRTSIAKRLLDVLVSSLLIILCAIPMAMTALLVRRKLGAPVIYSQLRPGRNGVPFRMYKFRSMLDLSGTDGAQLPDSQRLTAFGRKLRASSLDELPELWNVLKGDMSLVGPRPLLMRYSPFFRGRERLRLKVRPGITGWAQIHGRNTVNWDERLAYDAWYVENFSLKLDMKILLRTFVKVLRSDGVVTDPETKMRNLDDERTNAA